MRISVALGLATLKELFADELDRVVGRKGEHRADRGASGGLALSQRNAPATGRRHL